MKKEVKNTHLFYTTEDGASIRYGRLRWRGAPLIGELALLDGLSSVPDTHAGFASTCNYNARGSDSSSGLCGSRTYVAYTHRHIHINKMKSWKTK